MHAEPGDALAGIEVASAEAAAAELHLLNVAGDDRDALLPGDKVALIVENDLAFAKVLLQAARRAGFKGLVSSTGAVALALTGDHRPALITLDIHLPTCRAGASWSA